MKNQILFFLMLCWLAALFASFVCLVWERRHSYSSPKKIKDQTHNEVFSAPAFAHIEQQLAE